MITEEKVLVMDIDVTLCGIKGKNQKYDEVEPRYDILKKVIKYREEGFYIILYTSRNMRTHQGNIGRINADTAKTLFAWLDKHKVPYDEIHFGKPWCGRGGFYVDDQCIRPSEFLNLSYEEILLLLKKERQ